MVGACQQNSGIFLVRGGETGLGPDEMPTTKSPGLAAEKSPRLGLAAEPPRTG